VLSVRSLFEQVSLLRRNVVLVFSLAAAVFGCNLEDPNGLSVDDMFSVSVEPRQISADGVSSAVVTITLRGDTPSGVEVLLRTDMGRFGSLPPESGGDATESQEFTIKITARSDQVALISGTKAGTAFISASIDDFTQFDTTTFTRVHPEQLKLTSNRSVADANGADRVTLTAKLHPSGYRGTVTEGTKVLFEARDTMTGLAIPELQREADSDGNGDAQAELFSSTSGHFEITAFVESDPSVRDSLTIQFESAHCLRESAWSDVQPLDARCEHVA
jgi:hypothetical protein